MTVNNHVVKANKRATWTEEPCLILPAGCGVEAGPALPAPKLGKGAGTDWLLACSVAMAEAVGKAQASAVVATVPNDVNTMSEKGSLKARGSVKVAQFLPACDRYNHLGLGMESSGGAGRGTEEALTVDIAGTGIFKAEIDSLTQM